MRPSHLDQIARAIASRLSRRRLLGGLMLGLPASHLAPTTGSARIFCKKFGKSCDRNGDCCPSLACSKRRCACPRGYRLCDGVCRNLSSDANHCGACGNECDDPRQSCIAGVCLLIGTPVDNSNEPSPPGDVEDPGAPPEAAP